MKELADDLLLHGLFDDLDSACDPIQRMVSTMSMLALSVPFVCVCVCVRPKAPAAIAGMMSRNYPAGNSRSRHSFS